VFSHSQETYGTLNKLRARKARSTQGHGTGGKDLDVVLELVSWLVLHTHTLTHKYTNTHTHTIYRYRSWSVGLQTIGRYFRRNVLTAIRSSSLIRVPRRVVS
jgi:hypothetical protein